MDKIIITVLIGGGNVQEIRNIPKNVRVKVVDFDIDGCDESKLIEFEGDSAIISDWES